MQAPLLLPTEHPVSPPAPLSLAVPEDDARLIEVLRALARRAQLAAPMGLEHTCSLIAPGSAQTFGLALMRALDAVATRPLAFYPRAASEASFDELWLARLLRCIEAGDGDSARLLIGRRVNRYGRRTVTWLACGFAERLDEMDLDARSLEAF